MRRAQRINRKNTGACRMLPLGPAEWQRLAAERSASNAGLAMLLASSKLTVRPEQRAHRGSLLVIYKVQRKRESVVAYLPASWEELRWKNKERKRKSEGAEMEEDGEPHLDWVTTQPWVTTYI